MNIKKILYWITLIPPFVEWVQKIIKEVHDEDIKKINNNSNNDYMDFIAPYLTN